MAVHLLLSPLQNTIYDAPCCSSLTSDYLSSFDGNAAGDRYFLSLLVGELSIHDHKRHCPASPASFLVDVGHLRDGSEYISRIDWLEILELLFTVEHPAEIHLYMWTSFTVVPVSQSHEKSRWWHDPAKL